MKNVKQDYGRLPEVLNPHGVEMLCQAVLASGIKEQDIIFLNSPTAQFFIENGFKNISYSASKYNMAFSAYRKTSQPNQHSSQCIPVDEVRQKILTTPLKEIANFYGKSTDAMRAFCSRHGISRKRGAR